MESLKEFLTPKAFNKLSFVAVIFWIPLGVILLGIVADVESESKLDCVAESDKDDIERKCFEQYETQFNKLSIPLYGFVIINVSVIVVVSVIYSQCIKSTVEELEDQNRHNADAEMGQENPTRRRLFIAYITQLAFRISLRILFILLQTQVIFPNNFACNVMPKSGNTSVNASTNFVSQVYECANAKAKTQSFWTNSISVLNGIFAFFVFMEIVCILSRARKGKRFMQDEQFFVDHLKATVRHNQVAPERDSARESRQHNQNPQRISLLSPQDAVESNEQTQNEQMQESARAAQLQDSIQQEQDQVQSELQHQQSTLQDFIKTMKKNVKQGTEQPKDLKQPIRPNPGEGPKPKDLKTDEIYTNLKIQEGRAEYDFPTDRREQLKVYPQPNANKAEFKRPEDIIDAEHKNILIVGRPGIGKTLFCSKLLRDWASDKVFNDAEQNLELGYDVAFLLKFRRLSKLTELINLRELLCVHSEYPTNVSDEVWDYILQNPNKLLLMFDGTDEFPSHSEIATEDYSDYGNTAEERMPVLALYKKIADGNLLSGATLITTTRPTAVSSLAEFNYDRVVEILGFSSEQVEDYVEKFTKDDRDAVGPKETIWRHISTNLNLFSLSYIPMNCFIICSCLFYVFRTCGSSILPTKLTEIYSIAIKIFFFRHGSEKYRYSLTNSDQFVFKQFRELPSQVQDVFERLGEIAFKGIKQRKLIFESSEVEGLEDCGLLHRLPDRTGSSPLKRREAQYCFAHLTVQEFLAAKHLIDTKDDEQLRSFVEVHIKDGEWQVVIQFIAGLLKEQKKPRTDIFTNLLPVTVEKEDEDEDVEPRTLTWWPAQEDKHLALNLCKCLYEIDENDSHIQDKLAEINFNAVDFSKCSLAPVDCTAVVHILKNAKGILCINLRNNNIGPLGCTEIIKLIVNSDHHRNNYKLTHLNLAANNITAEGAKQLADTLMHSECKLTDLNLMGNNITAEGAKQLADALMHSECKLTDLDLAWNNITDEGAKQLADALMHSECKLTVLNLMSNNITDKGAKQLAVALMHSECKLTKLNLWKNNITAEGAKQLADALMHSECKLTELNLAANNITAEGAKQLADALMHSECKLTELNLRNNNITDKGAKQLAVALMHSECKLTDLDLTYNNITAEGKKPLDKARSLNPNISCYV